MGQGAESHSARPCSTTRSFPSTHRSSLFRQKLRIIHSDPKNKKKANGFIKFSESGQNLVSKILRESHSSFDRVLSQRDNHCNANSDTSKQWCAIPRGLRVRPNSARMFPSKVRSKNCSNVCSGSGVERAKPLINTDHPQPVNL